MKTRKQLGVVIASLVLALGLGATTSKAQDWNYRQATKFTFSQSVEIPGHTLPAGTYWFQLLGANTTDERDRILVYDATRRHLITSAESIPADHVTDVYDTEVTLTQPSDSQPAVLLTWFYPGDSIGHELYYSPVERDRLSEQGTFTAKAEPISSHGVILSASLR